MKYRKLGSTGIQVSEIGFGTWGLGGDSYGPVDDDVSTHALMRALNLGVTFYDTADLYGQGHSEELLGRVFKDLRDKIVIATKGGTLPHSGFKMPQDFSPGYLREALERSLRRLKGDYVDLYQLHSPTVQDINDEILELLEKFKKEGKIRTYGISVRSPDDGLIAIKKYQLPVLQVNYSMIDQRADENGLFDLAAGRGVGIIARTPLVFGYLTGRFDGNEQFQGTDHRSNWPKKQLKRWAHAPDLFAFLYTDQGRTPVQAALRFCLDNQVISTVIPGMMNIHEVEEDVEACDVPSLTLEEKQRIRDIYQKNTFYDRSFKKVQEDGTS